MTELEFLQEPYNLSRYVNYKNGEESYVIVHYKRFSRGAGGPYKEVWHAYLDGDRLTDLDGVLSFDDAKAVCLTHQRQNKS